MIGRFSCVSASCTKQVEFICNCTTPETLMCGYHRKNHLKSLKSHEIKNFSLEEHIIKTFRMEKSLMIEMKNILTVDFEQSPQESLRLKLLEIYESINMIEKLIEDYNKGKLYLNIDAPEVEAIHKVLNKNIDYLADFILKEKNSQIDEFLKKLDFLNDINEHYQLQAEFLQISYFDKCDSYIFALAKENTYINSSRKNYIQKCKNIQSLLDKSVLKIYNQNYKSHIIDFNYLCNYDENLKGTEIYMYDIEKGTRTSTITIKSYHPPHRLLDNITNILKVSNSHLLIIGNWNNEGKVYLMDIKTQAVRLQFNIWNCMKISDFIFYENYLYVFKIISCVRFDINSNLFYEIPFPQLYGRVFAVLFRNYILVSNSNNSKFYLYDLIIETYSEISFFQDIESQKFLFTDNLKAYLWIQHGKIYESEGNNPFKWNAIGSIDFGIRKTPDDIAYSNYMENLYISFIVRPKMYCYRFNKDSKNMELIYNEEVNN
ncbi:unnamed protein product [Blepharisma stoltei]|uniref:Uncharacterized protein n=1 Tax=Blepharisma stoltei TaxID=1481888 RepID=A0AAU9JH34_9CILI|nr:unnamed protein product [Blepharisma stoltei]